MPYEMRGARPDAMTLDITWAITLLLEHSHCFQQFKAGYFLDREKCFDRLPWSITYELEASMGYPTAWTAADKRFNKELLTAFRLGPLVGPFWSCTNAFRQGLASSVRRVALLMGVWVRRQLRTLTRPFIGNFFDDCLVVANTEAERQLSMDESDKFDELTGQRIGHKKTVGFVVPSGVASLTSRGTRLKQVAADKLLGVLVPTDNQRDTSLLDDRVNAASKHIPPIMQLPTDLESKASLMSIKTAGARYGIEVEEPSNNVTAAFDQQVLQGLCGQRALRCKNTSMSIAWPGHRLFLEMAIPYQTFAAARKQLERSAWLRDLFREVWEFRDAHDQWDEAGICCHIMRQCRKLGWRWEAPFVAEATHNLTVDLTCPIDGWYLHRLRVAIRQALLRQVPLRKDLEGIQQGVCYENTVKLLTGPTLRAEERCRLRYLWEGRVPTAERAAKHTGGCTNCPYCDFGVPETSMHISKDCPAFRVQRQQLLDQTTVEERAAWPPCFWNAGLTPHDPVIAELELCLGPFAAEDGVPPPVTAEDVQSEWSRQGRWVVAGDGACSDQGTVLARAGCGAFFGLGHSHNFAFKLEGPAQDSDRAELRALLRVARWCARPVEYLTDNEAVCIGFDKMLLGHPKPWKEHNDLWRCLREVVDTKGKDFLQVSFVKGHADVFDIATGRATPKEAQWNDAADKLAVQGASMHAVPAELKHRFRRQLHVTCLMQKTLLAIHAERTSLWHRQNLATLEAQAAAPPDDFAADEAAAAELHEAKPRSVDEQELLRQPKLALPRYCWDLPLGGTRCVLQPLPQRIGAAKKACDRHKGNAEHCPWLYGYHMLEPLYWFWASLEWVSTAPAAADDVCASSFAELCIAFQLLTGVVPARDADGANPTMHQRIHFFNAASRRLSAITGGPICPGQWLPAPDVLRRLRFQTGPGVEQRFVLPQAFWKHFCMIWARAHIELPVEAGKRRDMKWQPNFDRAPAPIWRSGAPIGFAAATKWTSARCVSRAVRAPGPACDAESSSGQIRVLQPGPPIVEKRVRGKQADASAALACELPAPKARAAVRPARLAEDELTADEQAQLCGLKGVARNQVLKLILHNRSAVELGKHYVVRGHAENSAGQLRCRDCEMTGRWQEWRFFSKIAKCKRHQ